MLLRLFEKAARGAANRIDRRIEEHNRHVAFWVKFGIAVVTAGLGAVPVPGVAAIGSLLGPVGDFCLDSHALSHPKGVAIAQLESDLQFALSQAKYGIIVPGLPTPDSYEAFPASEEEKLVANERKAWGAVFADHFEKLAGLI